VVLIWLTIKHNADILHARSQVAAAMAWLVSRLLRKRFIFDLRGQMAYEYADGGTWAADGLLFRLVERAERRFIRDADALVVLTRVLASDVAPLASCPLVIIPTCVDLDLFSQPSTFPQGEPPRMVYCGSLGARYAVHLLTTCFVHARQLLPELELLILTHSDPEPLRRSLEQAGGSASRYAIVQARHQDIPRYLSKALFGVLLLEGGRSLRGACPTKIGEYLAAGLPILSSPGIGDCTELLEGNNVGVVLKDHSSEAFREGIGGLLKLLEEGLSLRARCRLIAEKEFSLNGRGGPVYRALYRQLEKSR
jgi:glycosyltransferase involved in cell wall biosynthesis